MYKHINNNSLKAWNYSVLQMWLRKAGIGKKRNDNNNKTKNKKQKKQKRSVQLMSPNIDQEISIFSMTTVE